METWKLILIGVYVYGVLATAPRALSRTSRRKQWLDVKRGVAWPVTLLVRLEKRVREALRQAVM